MIVDVFLKVEVADVECTEEELEQFISSHLFGGLVRHDNPLEKDNIINKKEMLVKKSEEK